VTILYILHAATFDFNKERHSLTGTFFNYRMFGEKTGPRNQTLAIFNSYLAE